MKVAILIAVEKYSDAAIPSVKYARVDATDLAEALLPHVYEESDQVVLVDGDATKTIIESRVRRTIRSLSDDDTVLFYYAGHGFSKNGENYLTCYDTQLTDLESTSIKLESLFKQFRDGSAKRITMFLDSCESGMLATASMRGIYSDLTNDELNDFFLQSEHYACFSACKAGESSWPSKLLKHGVWTHHVIEAFKGNALLALERGSLLTSASLQNYLSLAVPRSLREAFVDKKVQTPWLFGTQSSEFLLADLSDLLERRARAASPNSDQVIRMAMVSEKVSDVRQLSGFKSSHRVPRAYTSSTRSFVASIANDDLQRELNSMLASLREAFGFKRMDLQSNFTDDGHATIITPYFSYTVDVALNEEDVSEVIWRQEVNDIKEPDQILSDEFEEVFLKTFDTIEFTLPNSVDIPTLIDRIEQLDDEQISVDYDAEVSWCSIAIQGENAKIHLTPSTMEIVQIQPQPPKVLIESFFQIQRALIDKHDIRMIEFREDQDS